MEITILKIILPLLFTLLILPLLLRFIIGKIILFLVKKRFINNFSQNKLNGNEDREAILKLQSILYKKLSSPFVTEYDLKNELISIILNIQNSYLKEENEQLQFTFSISDLIKCYFLLMSDLNSVISSISWLNSLKKRRVSTFKKINKISVYYNYLYTKIPFLKWLRKGRITGKITRLILIPFLGLPSVILSIFVSLISLFFMEIIWKYYYSVLLIKCAYYSMILYGRKEGIIKEKLSHFSSVKVKKMAETVEGLINPGNNNFRSDLFEKSFVEFQNILEEYGISPEKDIDFDGIKYRYNKKRKVFRKIFKIPMNVANQYNPLFEKKYSDRVQIMDLIKRIARVYTEKEKYYDDLRIFDIFEVFYMISVLSYSRLLIGSKILDNLSVDFVLKAKKFNDEIFNEILKNKIPVYKQIYKSFKLIRKGQVLYKAIRATNPIGFVLSFSGPIAFESVKDQVKDYVYQRAGRFTIYCYESNRLKRENAFIIPEDI